MTTYQPVLLRIKQAYDQVLQDALESAFDNIHIREELSMEADRMVGQPG